ncbi:BMP-binding endothelial regulator protein-like [Saccoglossus kowalevskii]|uniref:BMP-binding endothelial regulator protein-like n=1 Tax=Saccoglossus kowalevskii TaxID=10224 RepID=A0ABM0M2S9_SACKO|nr:PREDICTED: BMP-binding endothelial regulator protein-like [Saccoglossus kowalevskii]
MALRRCMTVYSVICFACVVFAKENTADDETKLILMDEHEIDERGVWDGVVAIWNKCKDKLELLFGNPGTSTSVGNINIQDGNGNTIISQPIVGNNNQQINLSGVTADVIIININGGNSIPVTTIDICTTTTTEEPTSPGVEKDPHFTTFDGVKYNFQGVCAYVLTQDCKSMTQPSFLITIDLRGKYSESRGKPLTRVDAVNIDVEGKQLLRIIRNNAFLIKGELFTNNSAVIGNEEGTVNIVDEHMYVDIWSPRISLIWNKDIRGVNVDLKEPSMRGNVCGLLGNYNGDPEDDFMKPNGEILSRHDIYELGESWMVPGSCDY